MIVKNRRKWMLVLSLVGFSLYVENIFAGHIQHFGFISSGNSTTYVDETAPFTTVVSLGYYDGGSGGACLNGVCPDGQHTATIEHVVEKGLKLIVDVSEVFFGEGPDGPYSRAQSDREARWAAVVERLRPFEDHIYAFMPLDEPFWNTRKSLSATHLKQYLADVAVLFERDFPNARRLIVFNAGWTFPKFSRKYGPRVPVGYDLLGFDYYDGSNFPVYHAEFLKSKANAVGAKLMLVPRGYQGGRIGFLSEQQLLNRTQQEYSYAQANPIVEIVMPYLWQSRNDEVGSRDLPYLREKWYEIGSEISGKELFNGPPSEEDLITISNPPSFITSNGDYTVNFQSADWPGVYVYLHESGTNRVYPTYNTSSYSFTNKAKGSYTYTTEWCFDLGEWGGWECFPQDFGASATVTVN